MVRAPEGRETNPEAWESSPSEVWQSPAKPPALGTHCVLCSGSTSGHNAGVSHVIGWLIEILSLKSSMFMLQFSTAPTWACPLEKMYVFTYWSLSFSAKYKILLINRAGKLILSKR